MKIQSIVAATIVALAASAAVQVVQLGAQTPAFLARQTDFIHAVACCDGHGTS